MKPRLQIHFHVGYVKTASTWLQRQIYPMLPLTLYMGKNGEDIMYSEAFNQLHGMLFEPLYGKTRYRSRNSRQLILKYSSAILDEIQKKISRRKGGNFILSNESILGYGNYNAELNVLLIRCVADQLKEELSSDFDVTFKLVIVFREQVSFLQSHFAYGYANYVDQFKTIEKFIDHGAIYNHDGAWGALWFDEVLDLLESFFSKDEILFIPYELLNISPESFLERIIVDTGLRREHIIALRDTPKENVNRVVDGSICCVIDRFLINLSAISLFTQVRIHDIFQRQCTLGLRE